MMQYLASCVNDVLARVVVWFLISIFGALEIFHWGIEYEKKILYFKKIDRAGWWVLFLAFYDFHLFPLYFWNMRSSCSRSSLETCFLYSPTQARETSDSLGGNTTLVFQTQFKDGASLFKFQKPNSIFLILIIQKINRLQEKLRY